MHITKLCVKEEKNNKGQMEQDTAVRCVDEQNWMMIHQSSVIVQNAMATMNTAKTICLHMNI